MGKQQYDNTNRGALFTNDKKKTDKHPDFTGSIDVAGRQYWLDGWKHAGREGKKGFISVSIKPKDGNGPAGGIRGRRDEFDL